MLKTLEKINKIVYLLKQLKQRKMKEVTITPPKGFVIDEEKSTFQKIVFKEVQKDIKERVQSFDDACREVGTTEKEFKKKYHDVLDEQGYAAEQAKVLSKAYNEGTSMNAFDTNQYKHYPYFNTENNNFGFRSVCYWTWGAHVPTCLCFKDSSLAEDAGKKFIEIYKKLITG